MRKFVVSIFIFFIVSHFCLRSNQAYAKEYPECRSDSISTTFTRNNVTYHGVWVWSMVNNPDKTYLCLNVNDTLLIVTDSEVLFNSPFYSLGRKEISKKYKHADIVHADEALPIGALVMSDGDYLLSYDRKGRLEYDGTRRVTKITYGIWGDLPRKIPMSNKDYSLNNYTPDGTLRERTFVTHRIKVVTVVNSKGDTVTRQRKADIIASHRYFGPFERIRTDSLDWRVHTPVGYYDIKHKKNYWYMTNRLGSVMAVVDGEGRVVQRTGIYPGGTPFVVDYTAAANDTVTDQNVIAPAADRLHAGNRWLGHSGLDWYDNTALMHDPLLMRFTSADPLFGKYPGINPWTHCAANPANILDPDGRDTLSVNNEGYISLVRPTEDNFDILIGREGNYLKIDKGNLEEIAREKRTKDNKTCFVFLYDIKDNDKAKNLFEFLAQNTNVEWSLVHIPNNNYLGTTHQETFDYTIDVILKGQTLDSLREMTYFCHSHTLASYASPTDIGLIEQLNALDICPYTEIYFVPKDKYIHYDSSGSNLLEIEIKSHRP